MAMKIAALTSVNNWYVPPSTGLASVAMRAHSTSV